MEHIKTCENSSYMKEYYEKIYEIMLMYIVDMDNEVEDKELEKELNEVMSKVLGIWGEEIGRYDNKHIKFLRNMMVLVGIMVKEDKRGIMKGLGKGYEEILLVYEKEAEKRIKEYREGFREEVRDVLEEEFERMKKIYGISGIRESIDKFIIERGYWVKKIEECIREERIYILIGSMGLEGILLD